MSPGHDATRASFGEPLSMARFGRYAALGVEASVLPRDGHEAKVLVDAALGMDAIKEVGRAAKRGTPGGETRCPAWQAVRLRIPAPQRCDIPADSARFVAFGQRLWICAQ